MSDNPCADVLGTCDYCNSFEHVLADCPSF